MLNANSILRLLESKQVGKLYHFTDYCGAIGILRSGKLLIGNTGYLSFTRSKDLHKRIAFITIGAGVRFEVDGDRLSNKYRIKPYSYHGLDVPVGDECEERIVGRNIDNFLRYVNSVCVMKFNYPPSGRQYRLLYREVGVEEPSFDEYVKYLRSITTTKITVEG